MGAYRAFDSYRDSNPAQGQQLMKIPKLFLIIYNSKAEPITLPCIDWSLDNRKNQIIIEYRPHDDIEEILDVRRFMVVIENEDRQRVIIQQGPISAVELLSISNDASDLTAFGLETLSTLTYRLVI
jgi:hypothetical protein